MSARILIVDDEPHVLEPLIDFFLAEGYQVTGARDGQQALDLAAAQPPDLVLLDWMLPVIDGIAVCRELRRRHPALPIVLLTAKDAEGDRVVGLDSGADDYVAKPFGMLELNARVRAHLRRVRRTSSSGRNPAAREPSEVVIGPCRLDRVARVVTREGVDVKLSAMELKLLEFLVAHAGQVIPRDRLLNEVWGYERYPSTRTVDTHIWKLRQKLERDPNDPRHFLTVHGIGYRFLLGGGA
ncbi:MAG: response regulator transcription factor [Planctomycetota bacterium]